MTSLLGQTLLSLLARAEGTGYDLARRMDRPVGYFWQARHSQIYPTLGDLEADGLVRHRVVEGAGPRPTKRYAVSAAGRRVLREWLRTPMRATPRRSEETLRVYSLWLADREDAVAFVTQRRAHHAQMLAEFEEQQSTIAGGAEVDDPSRPLWSTHAALQGGILDERAAVEWCDWMLERLRRGASG